MDSVSSPPPADREAGCQLALVDDLGNGKENGNYNNGL